MVRSRGVVVPPPDPLPWQSAIAERAGTPVTRQLDTGEVRPFHGVCSCEGSSDNLAWNAKPSQGPIHVVPCPWC